MRREESPAYEILRPSARRLLKYVISEIARNGGGRVVIHNDQLEMIGSRRIYLTGLYELHTVGLLDVQRFPKCHACQASDRWRDIGSTLEASMALAVARGPNRIVGMEISKPTQDAGLTRSLIGSELLEILPKGARRLIVTASGLNRPAWGHREKLLKRVLTGIILTVLVGGAI